MTYNERFTTYARSQGRTPDQQAVIGALGYYKWIRAKTQEYRAINAAAFRFGYLIDDAAFDAWLKEGAA